MEFNSDIINIKVGYIEQIFDFINELKKRGRKVIDINALDNQFKDLKIELQEHKIETLKQRVLELESEEQSQQDIGGYTCQKCYKQEDPFNDFRKQYETALNKFNKQQIEPIYKTKRSRSNSTYTSKSSNAHSQI